MAVIALSTSGEDAIVNTDNPLVVAVEVTDSDVTGLASVSAQVDGVLLPDTIDKLSFASLFTLREQCPFGNGGEVSSAGIAAC